MMVAEYQRPPVRVALMGLGRAMFADHVSIFKRHPALFKVVAACDLKKDRRDLIAKDFPDCKMFRRFSDMLDERNIDIVDIASCSVDHVKHAVMSLQKGFWTLIETPMALTPDDAQILRGQAMKSRNRLLVMHRGLFSSDYLLARQMMQDSRLGRIYQVRIRKEDYIRRDDWQCVKRLGGGAAYYAMSDLVLQALKLLPVPPIQMWSELKRVASLGDAEDFAHLNLKTREVVSADIEFNGGCISPERAPSFELRGERGVFKVFEGERTGTLTALEPSFKLKRRRASVRTPSLKDMHERVPTICEKINLPANTLSGQAAFWRCVYDTVRTASPFPLTVEDSIESLKFVYLMKKTSPFGYGK